MKKKIISAALCAVLAFSLAGCSLHAPDTDISEASKGIEVPKPGAIVLTYAEMNPPDTIVGMTAQKFKEEVESRSNGDIVVDVQYNGVLGSEAEVLDGMLGGTGTVDFCRITASALISYGGEKAALLSLPYTFVSREHFWNFAESDLAQEFLREPYENGAGVRGLFYGEEGFRNFFSKEPINSIEDMKGKKFRVNSDPIMIGLVNGLGANATEISFNELYSALQTGVCDGAEQPTANYLSNAFNEVAPNLILDGHVIGAIQIIIAETTWNKLSPEQQQILEDAGKATGEYNKEISEEKEKEVLEDIRAAGVNVVDVEDKSPWQEAVKQVVDDNIEGYEDLYQQILDLQ